MRPCSSPAAIIGRNAGSGSRPRRSADATWGTADAESTAGSPGHAVPDAAARSGDTGDAVWPSRSAFGSTKGWYTVVAVGAVGSGVVACGVNVSGVSGEAARRTLSPACPTSLIRRRSRTSSSTAAEREPSAKSARCSSPAFRSTKREPASPALRVFSTTNVAPAGSVLRSTFTTCSPARTFRKLYLPSASVMAPVPSSMMTRTPGMPTSPSRWPATSAQSHCAYTLPEIMPRLSNRSRCTRMGAVAVFEGTVPPGVPDVAVDCVTLSLLNDTPAPICARYSTRIV